MIIGFKSKSLEKLCINYKKARKKFGSKVADQLIQRIYELQAFENLQQVPYTPPFRRHKLKGNYSGLFAVDLVEGFRLIVKPIVDSEIKESELDLNKVKRIFGR